MRLAVLGFTLLVSVLAPSAAATDYYVDVTLGSDAALGTSPGAAWKTLTHAAQATPPGSGHVINVAPGVYSAASGEVFPIAFRLQHLVSDAGAGSTTIDGGGATSILDMVNTPATPVPGGLTTLRGIRLFNATTGIFTFYSWSTLTCRLEDVVFDNCSQQGLFASCGSFIGSGSSFHFDFERVVANFCGTGVQLSATAGSCSLDAVDSQFSQCTTGLALTGTANMIARLERCRITGNFGYGLWATPTNNGTLDLEVTDSLFAQNVTGYGTWTSSGSLAQVNVRLHRITAAQNSSVGILSKSGNNPLNVSTTLDGVLAWGNGVDLDSTNVIQNVFSQIGGADPLFRNTAQLDYRVTFGSPVIDAGNPTNTGGTADLAGVIRAVDGDLDTVERADVGAHEFETLETISTGALNTPLRFDFYGETGSTASLYFSRVAPVAPTATTFGELDLPVGQFGFLLHVPAGPLVPGSFTRTIPPNSLLIGRTFSFQARTTSLSSPSGAAWTNVRAVTFLP